MTIEQWHKGKVAVVTGGISGIGRAVAEALAQRGALVAVGARRADQADLPGILALSLDVTDQGSVDNFIGNVTTRLGAPSILVNNAGISVHRTVADHVDADWLTVIDTNLNGPYRMIKACLGPMKQSDWGRIVNVASTAARTAEPTHAAYCASKSGLVGLTRAVALEGAPHGITCTAVSPTWVETQMLRESAAKMAHRSGTTPEAEILGMAASNPQNRLVQPEEIAAMVSFLCSDHAPGLTMEDIQINAGAHW